MSHIYKTKLFKQRECGQSKPPAFHPVSCPLFGSGGSASEDRLLSPWGSVEPHIRAEKRLSSWLCDRFPLLEKVEFMLELLVFFFFFVGGGVGGVHFFS